MSRLHLISTPWALIQQAHSGSSEAREALGALFLRYRRAVYRYAFRLLNDDDEAETVCSEFARKLASGAFAGAAPEKGSFRYLLSRTTYNLALDRLRSKRNHARALPLDDLAADPAVFDDEWGSVCLDDAWRSLKESERENPHPPYYTVLRVRSNNTAASNADLARLVGEELGRTVETKDVGRWLFHARVRFARSLLETVEQTLEEEGKLIDELKQLGLYKYCRPVLEKRGLVS